MATQKFFALIIAAACVANSGCYGCLRGVNSCDSSYGCDSFADASCGIASCGIASYDLPDAECGCPEAPCDGSCATVVGCGSAVCGECPIRDGGRRLLSRIRNAFWGCTGCGNEAYRSEWHNDPPYDCESCDTYGNYTGGVRSYQTASDRRSRLSRRGVDVQDELHFAEETEIEYR